MSAESILEEQIYAALSGAISGATVFQDVPENEPYPIVMIGDMASEPLATKDDDDSRITVSIIALTSAEERAPVLALNEQVKDALKGSRFHASGWTFAGQYLSADAVIAEDGVSYVGTSSFAFLALKD